MNEKEKPKSEVYVLSKNDFQSICCDNAIDDDNVEKLINDVAFVSITDPNFKDSVYFKDNHKNVINVFFHDMTDKELLGYTKKFVEEYHISPTIFDESHASALLKFMKDNQHVSQWMIHCHAGISRSGAVGSFIATFLSREKWESFKNRNYQIQPNYYVYRILYETAKKEGYINDDNVWNFD